MHNPFAPFIASRIQLRSIRVTHLARIAPKMRHPGGARYRRAKPMLWTVDYGHSARDAKIGTFNAQIHRRTSSHL
jgi:hypothetical protein